MDAQKLEALLRRDDVVGVFWDSKASRWVVRYDPRAGGGWDAPSFGLERGLRQHDFGAIDKDLDLHLPSARPEPARTLKDVVPDAALEAGGPIELHVAKGGAETEAATLNGPPDGTRTGTVTAIAAATATRPAVALLSGHATSPKRSGRIELSYRPSGAPSGTVGIPGCTAHLLRAEIGGTVDFGLAEIVAGIVDALHPVTNLAAPYPTVGVADAGTPVRHVSRVRGRPVDGRVRVGPDPSGLSGIKVGIDGRTVLYRCVWAVESLDGEAFSSPGDSGSLVFVRNKVLGMLVAGDRPGGAGGTCSYVLPARALANALGVDYGRFFYSP